MVKKEATVKFELREGLLEKVNALKKHYRVQSSAELVRILVNEKTQQLNIGPMEAITNANQ